MCPSLWHCHHLQGDHLKNKRRRCGVELEPQTSWKIEKEKKLKHFIIILHIFNKF